MWHCRHRNTVSLYTVSLTVTVLSKGTLPTFLLASLCPCVMWLAVCLWILSTGFWTYKEDKAGLTFLGVYSIPDTNGEVARALNIFFNSSQVCSTRDTAFHQLSKQSINLSSSFLKHRNRHKVWLSRKKTGDLTLYSLAKRTIMEQDSDLQIWESINIEWEQYLAHWAWV